MSEQYIFAVARIRALEVKLLSDADIAQLVSTADEKQCLQILSDKGFGDMDTAMDSESMMTREEEKIWETVRELSVPMDTFDVLRWPKQFHNLKAALKAVYTNITDLPIYYEDTPIAPKVMESWIREREFDKLPKNMQEAAKDAYEALFHTGDGQLCDVIVDQAALTAIAASGRASKAEIIRDYAESTVAVADIKIAVRCAKTGKSAEFMKRAMAECDTINVAGLIKAALSGMDAICEYLRDTIYKEGAEALAESPSAFERWCDDRLIRTIKPQKYESFGIGPVVAYVIARLNEIKTVRIILSGKANGLSVAAIRERVREMYV